MTTENNRKVRNEPSCRSSCSKQRVKDEFRFQQAEYINRTTVAKFAINVSETNQKPETRNAKQQNDHRMTTAGLTVAAAGVNE